jgi:restriction system protein
MDIPKFHETFIPILETLADGKIIQHRELLNKIVEKYYSQLSKELLEKKTKTGDLLILNRIAWGKSYLKKAGYIHYPERGAVQITQKGKEVNRDKVNLKGIISESGIFNFYKEERTKELEDLEMKGSSPQDLIESGFSAIEGQVKSDLLDRLKSLDPFYFEKVILTPLNKMGYGESIETSKTGDGGIDGIINQDKLGLEKIYIQAKRYNENKVREKEIRNFIGAMSGDTTKGVFVTTSEFDQQAIKKAHDAHHTIILIDGKKLVDLLYQYSVGVQVQDTYDVKAVDDNFFDKNY